MDILMMILQLFLALSILVGVHEFGHFIAARMFGMRVERFYIFFNPWFKLFSRKVGETEYGLGWLPLGGYVKIAGMMDESLDKEQLSKPPQPWEFRSKPAFARLVVMVAGVTLNLLLGMGIFSALVMANGVSYLPAAELNKHGIAAYELGEEMGFKTGDKVLSVNGKPIERFSDILSAEVLLEKNVIIQVERNGAITDVRVPDNFADRLGESGSSFKNDLIAPRAPFTVGEVMEGSNAMKAGLREGDRITAVNGDEIVYFDQLSSALRANREKVVKVTVQRKNTELNLEVLVNGDGTIGFYQVPEINYSTDSYGLAGSVITGSGLAWKALFDNIKGFGKIISGELSFQKSVQGPIGIARMYGSDVDWGKFWTLTGLLSMFLAFVNLLPIPAVDGGHVVFLLAEIVSGRKPSMKLMEVMQMIGMVIIIGLMVLIIGNDIINATR